MGRHAKPRRFTLVRRALPSGGSDDRRVAGEAWGHELPEQGYLIQDALEATDTGTLRRFLEAMRSQLVSEQAGTPVRITPEAIRQTADYVFSGHLDKVDDAELTATVLTLRGYLTALVDEAEGFLDGGRAVVREMVGRARAIADEDDGPNRRLAQHAAATTRDLLSLLEQEGWQGADAREAVSA
ncbi:DUF6415 family natural product biosynthesis protein [Streptomyces chattanoogensis]|uniref:DUF6415 family natural product biosynthesis protein n=1 Tax=Streptomyces chattanoogensis TaxID=66876 RepID=UPI00368C2A63